MNKKEKQAWRTIVAILQETGYDNLYDEEVHIVAECLRRCEQQCKKQKEVIDRIKEYINPLITDKEDKEYYPINFYVKDVLLSILKEVSE